MEGASQGAVVKTLREKGLIPLKIEEAKSGPNLQMDIKIPGLTDRVKPREVAVFSRQFATMVNSGLSLIRTLTILEQQTENAKLTEVVGEVRADVEKGLSLSAALEKHPKVFGTLYVAMVKAGEVGGVLDETLIRLAEMMESAAALRSKVKSAMAYPAVVMGLVVVIVVAMLMFVVPMFENMYADLGGDLPLTTKLLIGISEKLQTYWYMAMAGTIALVVGIKRWKKTDSGLLTWDTLMLKVPVFGKLTQKTAISRFSRTLGVLSRTGVPILQAIDIVGDTAGNKVVTVALEDVSASVKAGESLSVPLRDHDIFPPMVVQMMAVGEETGALDTMLGKVADFYDREIDATVEALTSLIEPLLIIVMGATVGGILIALYLPMFNIANLIQ